jgi:hypothetical protein
MMGEQDTVGQIEVVTEGVPELASITSHRGAERRRQSAQRSDHEFA